MKGSKRGYNCKKFFLFFHAFKKFIVMKVLKIKFVSPTL